MNYPFSHIMKTEHLPELSVLMSMVHDKKERRKSNALRSTNLRDSDQHWNSPNMPAVFFINNKIYMLRRARISIITHYLFVT